MQRECKMAAVLPRAAPARLPPGGGYIYIYIYIYISYGHCFAALGLSASPARRRACWACGPVANRAPDRPPSAASRRGARNSPPATRSVLGAHHPAPHHLPAALLRRRRRRLACPLGGIAAARYRQASAAPRVHARTRRDPSAGVVAVHSVHSMQRPHSAHSPSSALPQPASWPAGRQLVREALTSRERGAACLRPAPPDLRRLPNDHSSHSDHSAHSPHSLLPRREPRHR